MPNEVDTSLHPHPSGRAFHFASQHSSPSPSGLTLYGGWFCPFVQRVWITLHEKCIPHQYIEINPYHKDPYFLKLNPRGLVPTLAIAVPAQPNGHTAQPDPPKQKILYESNIVAEYLDSTYPSPPTQDPRPLLPHDPYARARAKIHIDHISTRIVPAFYRFLQHTPEKPYSLAAAREEFRAAILTFIRDADPAGPYFAGPDLSMVDVAFAPWACRIFLLDHYKGGSGISEPGRRGDGDGDGDDEAWERWHRWFDAVTSRKSVVETLSDRERYVEAYQRYAEDTTGSAVGTRTREGRGLV